MHFNNCLMFPVPNAFNEFHQIDYVCIKQLIGRILHGILLFYLIFYFTMSRDMWYVWPAKSQISLRIYIVDPYTGNKINSSLEPYV